MTETTQSPVVIEEKSIFDALALSITKELGPDEMTRSRFCEKYNVSLGGAIAVLEKAVKDGKLRKERRTVSYGTNGSYTTAYIPVE